jgi:hypothetical protein
MGVVEISVYPYLYHLLLSWWWRKHVPVKCQ